jgi:chemotaxis protein histidine kinase CheA
MGGDITVKSIFGKGTTFFIELKTKVKVLKQDLIIFEKQEIAKKSKLIKSHP